MNLKAQSGKATVYAACIDQELFDEGYSQMAAETLKLTTFTDTEIAGDITALYDGLLYVSVVCEGRWKEYVDGVESEIIPVDGSMAAVRLSEGSHKVEFRYYNPSLTAGICISLLSLTAFAAMIAFDISKRRRRARA